MHTRRARMRQNSRAARAAEISHATKKPIVVAIAGGSGSGKTWLTHKLHECLGPLCTPLSLDSFYRDRSRVSAANRARINFDHPRAVDWLTMEKTLCALAAGRAVTIPVYDFKTHSRLKTVERLSPRPVILVEGLWPLRRRAIQRLVSLSIFLDCPAKVRLRRRMARDLASRGRTSASVRRQFRDCVEPMHLKYVAPQAKRANLVLSYNCGKQEVRMLVSKIREMTRNA
jgi:uridine kinase